ncbi:glutathione S-transferase [Aquabacterium commune]|uniref:Glutathione S-transferase n=1 Tax=Aquabacterium commune TaxID=70586 RepID=A0A4R6RPD4_9BURK|nr:glutathione S-transferase N-terminal domain-containing protein [Aquabacterium commune]TDP88603.1 glutathione S-transferase [Aquabacterium commune]
MPPLLYTYRRCPYAMRARMALLQAGRRFRACEIVLRDKPAELLALSPKGTVPVLVLPGGEVLEQSWDIMRWAWCGEGGHAPGPDEDGWWARAQTPENLALVERNDGAFKRLLDRHKYPERFTAEGDAAACTEALHTCLLPLERWLQAQAQAHFGGATPCATDLALFPFVRQFAAVDPAWFAAQALPALQAWLAGWLASPLFAACMAKLPVQRVVDFPGRSV